MIFFHCRCWHKNCDLLSLYSFLSRSNDLPLSLSLLCPFAVCFFFLLYWISVHVWCCFSAVVRFPHLNIYFDLEVAALWAQIKNELNMHTSWFSSEICTHRHTYLNTFWCPCLCVVCNFCRIIWYCAMWMDACIGHFK